MCGMSFLPQELSGTQERSGLLLPTYHGTPLIVYLRQVSVRMDVILIEITEQGLGSRSDAKSLGKFVQSSLSNPCYFGCETFYMILLLV